MIAATSALAACQNNPAEQTLLSAATAMESNDMVALENTLVNELSVRYNYTSDEMVSFYSKLFNSYKKIKLENVRADKTKFDSGDTVYLVADITGRPTADRINYRNGTADGAKEDNRVSRRLGDRELIRFVKFNCEASSNKFGYEDCKISSFAYASKTDDANESHSDGPY